jgi:hypothetical protein
MTDDSLPLLQHALNSASAFTPERLMDAVSSSGGLRPNHQINVTVEHLQQGQDLIDRLAVVRLIDKAIQLRRRRP